jgi:integrase
LRIPAEAEIGNTNRLLPMARTQKTEGRRVRSIGKTPGVVTGEKLSGGEAVRMFAGAHDLRRTFGTRWSRLVMPALLQVLMRHVKIDTTMQYYVDQRAKDVADDLWDAFEAKTARDVNTRVNSAENPEETGAETSII